MKRTTIVIIPEGAESTKQFQVPKSVLRGLFISAFGFSGLLGYFILDYSELRVMRNSFYQLAAENEGLKGEARLLMNNLEDVKISLRRVQDYSAQLGQLTKVRVKKVSKKTGIGPLSPDEFKTAIKNQDSKSKASYMPLGVNLDNLIFRPVFDRLNSIGKQANKNALELQYLLSTLSQQKSLLSSIPAISPVNGWVTSGYGPRISPFTGKRSMHLGIDVASPIGTPIYAPANGVVIFTGAKAGFGNFIMIAHGYGIVSRYGHNAQNLVQPGQRIKRGDQIGTVGMTGRSTGPHLHYEILVNGRSVDPRKFILPIDETFAGI